MGILKERVAEAFKQLDKGNFDLFAKQMIECGDVHWDWHRKIVDYEVDEELKKRHVLCGITKCEVGDNHVRKLD